MQDNKAVVRRAVEDLWGRGNLALLEELFARDFVDHTPFPGAPPGRESVRHSITMFRTAFPDIRPTVDEQLAEGDKVVTRWTARGTHGGELMGVPPSNRSVTMSGVTINRVAGGKIVEDWTYFDQMGLMQQIGAMPPPSPQEAGRT